jgi:hypothetical protein
LDLALMNQWKTGQVKPGALEISLEKNSPIDVEKQCERIKTAIRFAYEERIPLVVYWLNDSSWLQARSEQGRLEYTIRCSLT